MGRVTVQQDNYGLWRFTRITEGGGSGASGTSAAFQSRAEAEAVARADYPDDDVFVDGDNGELAPPMPVVQSLTEADTMGLAP